MTEAELDVILARRGYRQFKKREPPFRSWLWVEPTRDGPKQPTKLCQGWLGGLKEEGLHFLLDHDCELIVGYYTEEDRRNNVREA